MNPPDVSSLVLELFEACGRVYDPEFGVSVRDLGLIHGISAAGDGTVVVTMTLTSRYCPAGEIIASGVKSATEAVPGVRSVRVDLVWEPQWTPERLSPAARVQLGWDESRMSGEARA